MEPFYLRQSGEPRTRAEMQKWFEECAQEARARGAKLCRFTVHATIPHLTLTEGWSEKIVSDQGEPRWQFAAQG